MKSILKLRSLLKLALIAIIMTIPSKSKAQQLKPNDSGYAPANGIQVYYEVYGEGKPIILTRCLPHYRDELGTTNT